MTTATNCMAYAAGDRQNGADAHGDDAQNPDDRDLGDEADDQQDHTEQNHEFPPLGFSGQITRAVYPISAHAS